MARTVGLNTWRAACAALAIAVIPPSTVAAAVSGVQPDRRPADAPVVTGMAKDARWYRQALTGVDEPYPASLRFLEDQGAWYTPFTRPGMTGPYDLRGWHRTPPATSR